MKLESLSLFFEERLKKKMPGESAYSLMQPKLQNGSNIRFNHSVKPKEGGVLILLYEEDGVVKFPLIERQDYDGIHSGQISLPGGKKEDEDLDLVQTALRETEEEIGINRSEVRVLGSLTQFFVGASNFDILPVIGVLQTSPKFEPDSREVKEIVTPSVLDLLNIEKRRTTDINVRNGYMLSSPYFDLENKMVWGATAMMLSELVPVLNEFNTSINDVTKG
ncbi:MAG: CoA pyrophosphatase [Cyclobacteriaceae bacterium]